MAELKDRYLAQATGPRQKALLEPLIDQLLDKTRYAASTQRRRTDACPLKPAPKR